MKRSASAVWEGNLKDGQGTISTESGVLSQTSYSFSTRFENGRGWCLSLRATASHAGTTGALVARRKNRRVRIPCWSDLHYLARGVEIRRTGVPLPPCRDPSRRPSMHGRSRRGCTWY